MSNYVFLFDLDSTITKQEILPTVSNIIGKNKEMQILTERTMLGEIPFKQSFIERVKILQDIPVSQVREKIRNIALNDSIAKFIKNNRERCYVVTGNIDVWIEDLIYDLHMEKNCFCSKALVKNDHLEKIISILDKNAVIEQIIQPFVAIGDGNNDAEMIGQAEVGIGFGGVRPIAPSVLGSATHAFYDENKMSDFLQMLL